MALSFDLPTPAATERRRLVRVELLETFQRQGAQAGATACRNVLDASPDDLDESSLNYIGYFLLAERRMPEAVAVFELLIEAFPYSANAHHSLGEAYLETGFDDRAEVSYAMFQALGPIERLAATVCSPGVH